MEKVDERRVERVVEAAGPCTQAEAAAAAAELLGLAGLDRTTLGVFLARLDLGDFGELCMQMEYAETIRGEAKSEEES